MSIDQSVVNESLNFEDGSQRSILEFIRREPRGSEESTRILSENNRSNEGNDGSRHYLSMAKFARTNQQAFKDLESEIQEMGNKFFDYTNGKIINSSWRYISDVILYRNSRQLSEILQVLCNYGRSRLNGMFGFSVEDDHIHVIHDCAFSDGTCRDVWRKQVESIGEIRPSRKENKSIWKFTRTDWYDVFIYFFLRKRGTRKIWIRGESWKAPSDAQLVRWEEKYNSWRQVVRSEDSGSDSECERQSNKRSSRAASLSCDNEIYGKKSRKAGKFSYIREKTKALLLKYYCCPITAIQDVDEFRNDDILCDPNNDKYLLASFRDFGRDLMNYSLRDYYNMLMNSKSPLFNTSMDYGSQEESLIWIDDLLKFQFNDDLESICHFLTSLVDVIDKRLPKCNSLCVKSPPTAGKNFFFDMIFAIILNYGQLGQANKHNVFAFQEAPNKRLLLWNEPNYCASLTDTIKMMLGGDPYTVRVKHMQDTHVKRTPVIILTNNNVNFMSDIAFRERIVKFEWKYAPMLKNIEMKPYPLSFFDLLNKYNIEFYIYLIASNGYKPA